MTELGANCLRLFTPPPRWLLDLAAERNLWVLVGIPWAEHVCFLDSEEISDTGPPHRHGRGARPAAITRRSARFLVGNEIPPDIVRWYGARASPGSCASWSA